jgi:hypothetical protein
MRYSGEQSRPCSDVATPQALDVPMQSLSLHLFDCDELWTVPNKGMIEGFYDMLRIWCHNMLIIGCHREPLIVCKNALMIRCLGRISHEFVMSLFDLSRRCLLYGISYPRFLIRHPLLCLDFFAVDNFLLRLIRRYCRLCSFLVQLFGCFQTSVTNPECQRQA